MERKGDADYVKACTRLVVEAWSYKEWSAN